MNARETSDLPLIVVTSKGGRHVAALALERAIWASANVGDDRACFHLILRLGRIEPGQKATVHGQFWVFAGTPEDARQRPGRAFPNVGR